MVDVPRGRVAPKFGRWFPGRPSALVPDEGHTMASPVQLGVLDATVFVDCLSIDADLVDVVAEILDGEPDSGCVSTAHTLVVIEANEDADAQQAPAWPGGFLFFPTVLEVYPASRSVRSERASVTARLLTSLWSRGIAAVAACEYEDLLPAASGAGDRTLPWPRVPSRTTGRRW